MQIIEIITSWPAIIQGALGSALFALLLYVGQATTKYISSRLRKDKETAEFFALLAWSNSEPFVKNSHRAFFICVYAAIHYFIKAMIIFIFAWLLSSYISIFSMVGYLISAYFLFRALSYVPHRSSLGEIDDRLKGIIEEATNKKKQADV